MIDTIDLMLLGHEKPPRKLARAIEIVARDLHPSFEAQDWIKPGISQESCVLCSLTVRDFLRSVGFASAEAVPVMLTIRAFDPSGEQIHSLGVGVPNTMPSNRMRWNGHMVVTVGEWLIDCTMGRMRRPQWSWLMGTAVAPLWKERVVVHGWHILAGGGTETGGNGHVEIAWHALADDDWQAGPDTQEWRRIAVRDALAERYGVSRE